MEIFFSILLGLTSIFCILLIIDRTTFTYKVRNLVDVGMTGKEVQERTGLKLHIIAVDNRNKMYEAKVSSLLSIFRCRMIFIDGKLARKIWD